MSVRIPAIVPDPARQPRRQLGRHTPPRVQEAAFGLNSNQTQQEIDKALRVTDHGVMAGVHHQHL